MTKRISALICAVILLISLAACNNTDDKSSTEATEAPQKALSAEEVFDKAFEADKNYDIDAMAEVEYTINFSKTLDKDACVKSAKDKLAAMDEEQLKKTKESMSGAKYTITKQAELSRDELTAEAAKLSESCRDTDKISKIIKFDFTVELPDVETYVPVSNSAEMICVDGTWYCYMGDTTWSEE